MMCENCIHNTVCYEKEEDRQALTFCSDYFNLTKELEKIKTEMISKDIDCRYEDEMTLNYEIVELRKIASLIGGNHLTNKEAEQKINDIADNIAKIQENIALTTDKAKEDINYSLLGVDERYLYLIKRQRSFDELNNDDELKGE